MILQFFIDITYIFYIDISMIKNSKKIWPVLVRRGVVRPEMATAHIRALKRIRPELVVHVQLSLCFNIDSGEGTPNEGNVYIKLLEALAQNGREIFIYDKHDVPQKYLPFLETKGWHPISFEKLKEKARGAPHDKKMFELFLHGMGVPQIDLTIISQTHITSLSGQEHNSL